MKRISVRILAVLAAFVLLVAAVPTVAAEDAPRTLVLDTPQTVEVSKRVTVLFTYTANEAGTYIFRSQAPTGTDPVGQLLDENGGVLASNDDSEGSMNFRLDVDLAAGESCTFLVKSNHVNPRSFPVTLFKALEPTKVEMLDGQNNLTLSLLEKREAGTVVYPENVAIDTITYTSADNAVVTVDEDGVLTATGAGTTTVTVTVDGTLTDTVTVHVPEPLVWGAATKKDIILTAEPRVRTYRFTVEQDGRYEIFSEGVYDTHLEVYEQTQSGYRRLAEADDENGYNFALTRAFQVGKTYYLLLGAYGVEGALTYPVTVRAVAEDTTPETGVAFVADRITVSVGDLFLPAYRIGRNETVKSVTAADDSIVSNSNGGPVTAQKEGETTLTIQTASGATDTIAVTVTAPTTLVLGQKTSVAIGDVRERHYVFRPEKTGLYVLRSFGASAACVALYDDEWNTLEQEDADGDFRLVRELTGGKTYYVEITNNEPATFDVLIVEALAATNVTLTLSDAECIKVDGDTYYVFVGAFARWQVAFGAAEGAIEEPYDLTVGDNEVAAVSGDGFRFLASGETTITVTTENGLTDTITVIVVEYVPGDVTLDGNVTAEDLAALRAYLQDPAVRGKLWYLADYNQDGEVNAADVAAMEADLPEEPGGNEPGGDEPGGNEPGGDEPGGNEPGGNEPGGNEPGGNEPGGNEPGGNEPGGNEPGGNEPGGDEPGGDEPGGNEPGGNEPGGNEPGGDEPGGDTPVGAPADVDGDREITSTDARLLLQIVAGKIKGDNLNLALADVDGDGDVTSTDARLILQKVAGKISAFPVE